jgi:tetratricopeptide (TPR) repeat protein
MTLLDEVRMNIKVSLGILALCSAALCNDARADEDCDSEAGRLVSVQGAVEVQSAAGGEWREASIEGRLCQGDTIRVGLRSRAAIALINDAVLRIDENTTMRLLDVTGADSQQSWLDLLEGAIMSFSRKPKLLKVSTPYLNGSIEGTEFLARVQDDTSQITVFEGRVVTSNAEGSLSVSGGETAIAAKGEAPQPRTLVRPRDAVQWSLYYPPILALEGSRGAAVNPSLREAADLLSLGRVEEARSIVERAIADGPDAGLAFALRAVIKVTQNDRASALSDAEQAVRLTDAAAATIALSYALQASLRLEAARDALLQAVEQHPNDALAWARLGELQLMLGERRAAREAAQRAVALQPGLSRTQIVLGFAALTEIRIAEARAAFEQAIVLDSADPLPRLGLGLAKIRRGALAEGGREIETAVALDSNNSLLRSYLGKTYFEEKRPPLDAEQFAIAKELDPLDPTPYLYDAIRLQTENQPVRALEQIERSIELNDNRAIYRGRLLLDQDRAARGTSQARIYNDLGFTQLGINQAAMSLAIDPSNASAHRFLSDIYRASPRAEVSRVSDLLQSQLLQDININPIQPSVAATNLNIVARGGPAAAGFNEFTPLFERNQIQPNFSAIAGSNGTSSFEGVLSGIYDRVSFSAGGFQYDTDGFRENGDLSHQVATVYGQAALSDVLNVQAEYGTRHSEWGDIAMKFNPEDVDPTYRRTLDADIRRLGARLTPTPSSNILLSVIGADRTIEGTEKDELFFIPELGSFDLRTDVESEDATDQYDIQYLFQGDVFNLTLGGTYADLDRRDTLTFVVETPFGEDPPIELETEFTVRDKRAYAYGNIHLLEGLIWTLGLSYQDYTEGDVFEFDETSPKLGIQWQATEALVLRGAYFQGVKPVLSSNRTLEPTQIAGFNQYFDDANGTKFDRYGIGADLKVSRSLFFGAEVTRRDLESPVISEVIGEGIFEDREEWLNRVYAYWTPSDRWALSAEVSYDKFENQTESVLAFGVPETVTTLSIPLIARYFHPNGFFASVGLTYVDQEVTGEEVYAYQTGNSDFAVVDLGVGYRLPKRWGILSLSVQNVLDEQFHYLDNSYRSFQDEPTIGPFIPDRAITAQLTLNF